MSSTVGSHEWKAHQPAGPERAGPLLLRISWLVPLSVLPSAVWRMAVLAGAYGADKVPLERIRADPSDILLLSGLSVLGGFLSLGLPRRWSRVFPRWMPALGGRRVPFLLAVVPPAAAAGLLIVATLYAILNGVFHWVGPLNEAGEGLSLTGRDLLVGQLCYAPLLLTGPLLAWLTIDHVRRRRPAGFGDGPGAG